MDEQGSGPSGELRYRWTGREFDVETGWYFHRARYYDPAVRRFVQEGPSGYAGSQNLYAYVDGRPTEARDPSGLGEYDPWYSGFCLQFPGYDVLVTYTWSWEGYVYGTQSVYVNLVPPQIVQLAEDLSAPDGGMRSRAVWALFRPGVLDCVWNAVQTREGLVELAVPVDEKLTAELGHCALILESLPQLERDPDLRVRVAAREVYALVRAWERIEAGQAMRPSLEGNPVVSIGLLRLYLDIRSQWLRPVVRLAKRMAAKVLHRMPIADRLAR